MTLQKDDHYRIQRMINFIDIIESYYETLTLKNKKMMADDQDSDGIIYKFSQLREEAKKLSSSFLQSHLDIQDQINLLIGLRNRIIHDYEHVSYDYFDEIIEDDLPKLKKLLKEALDEELNG